MFKKKQNIFFCKTVGYKLFDMFNFYIFCFIENWIGFYFSQNKVQFLFCSVQTKRRNKFSLKMVRNQIGHRSRNNLL